MTSNQHGLPAKDGPEDPRKKRKSAPKSKLGCTTCKERHVKCDEARPACKRCIKTGRECAGYVDQSRKMTPLAHRPLLQSKTAILPMPTSSTAVAIVPAATRPIAQAVSLATPSYTISPVLSDFIGARLSQDETTSLAYFRDNAASSFPGPFDGEFWTGLLLRASRSEMCVRYAMIAVSHMHRRALQIAENDRPRTPPEAPSKPAAALEHYNKAITALSEAMARGECATSTVLMCCALFICLETLQGESQAFINHVRNGRNLVLQWRSRQGISPGLIEAARRSSSYDENVIIERHLVPFLTLQNAFANCFLSQDFGAEMVVGDKTVFQAPVSIPPYFQSLEEARDSIMRLVDLVASFAHLNGPAKYSGAFDFSDVADMHRLQAGFRAWRIGFDDRRSAAAFAVQPAAVLTPMSALLETLYHANAIWLATSLSPEQSSFDRYMASFRAIMDAAPLIIDTHIRSRADTSDGGSSIDGGDGAGTDNNNLRRSSQWCTALMPQLCFVAMLCRDATLRRQALVLLGQCLRAGTGIWSKPVPVLLALTRRWIEIEEAAIPRGDEMGFVGERHSHSPPPRADSISRDGGHAPARAMSCAAAPARLPPEHARIHFARLANDGGPRGPPPHVRTARFYSKPRGPYAAWCVDAEQIVVAT